MAIEGLTALSKFSSTFGVSTLTVCASCTVSSVDSEIEEALVDSACSEAPAGETGYESDLAASDSSVLRVELVSNETAESSSFVMSSSIAIVS